MGRQFHIGDILTITTGRIVSPRMMDGVYDILNFMTADKLYTHQLPRAMEECKPYLLKQYPQLAEVEIPDFKKVGVWAWLFEQGVKYGEHFDVEPIPQDDHTFRDPIEELLEMTSKPVVVIEAEEEG
jgi:hypothetical protein